MDMPVTVDETVLTISGSQVAFGEKTTGHIAAADTRRRFLGDAQVEIDDTRLESFVFNCG